MPCTKKLINNPDEIVGDSLIGLVATHDHLHLLRQYDNDDEQDHDDAEDSPVTSQQEHRGEEESTGKMSVLNVVVRSDLEQIRHEQITLISGGGAGHDPAHVGYVGRGMLSAAICGHVFTSPDVDTILTTIRSCTVLPEEGSSNRGQRNETANRPVGCLLIVKNYTGDRLNFGLAAELARSEGYNVEMVVVGDDCALNNVSEGDDDDDDDDDKQDDDTSVDVGGSSDHDKSRDTSSQERRDRRRGIAGTCFVHKLVGAFVERNRSKCTLDQVKQFAEHVCSHVSTIGVGLSACIMPGHDSASFDVPEDKVEFGLGIHGEKGVAQHALVSADETARILLEYVMNDMVTVQTTTATIVNATKHKQPRQIALMVNNLGSTTNLEMYTMCKQVLHLLESKYQLEVVRVYVGHFMTALDMSGVSLSILLLDDSNNSSDSEQHPWITLLDEPTTSLAWPKNNSAILGSRFSDKSLYLNQPATALHRGRAKTGNVNVQDEGARHLVTPMLLQTIRAICHCIIDHEPVLTEMDSQIGDGDMGISFKRGANSVLNVIESLGNNETQNMPIHALLNKIGRGVRAAQGGSSGVLLSILFSRMSSSFNSQQKSLEESWIESLGQGIEAMSQVGGAKAGDKTMLDTLIPVHQYLKAQLSNKREEAEEVEETAPSNKIDCSLLLSNAATVAMDAANKTRDMAGRRGRAGYLSKRAIGYVDPGAYAMALIVQTIAKTTTHSTQ